MNDHQARRIDGAFALVLCSTRCYLQVVTEADVARVFKTAWFAKAARRARLSDGMLWLAIREVMIGQAEDLGGGVFKKRLDKNRSRAIILAKGGRN